MKNVQTKFISPQDPAADTFLGKLSSVNVSVNFKPDHYPPPRQSPGIRMFPLPGGRVFAQLSLSGGQGFELKMQELLDLFQRNRRQLESRCSCAVSYQFLQKQ